MDDEAWRLIDQSKTILWAQHGLFELLGFCQEWRDRFRGCIHQVVLLVWVNRWRNSCLEGVAYRAEKASIIPVV